MTGVISSLARLLSRVFGSRSTRPVQRTQRGRTQISQMPGGDQVIWGVNGPDMDAAIQAARETLHVFWAWHETRPLDRADQADCSLKVPVQNRWGGWEYIWLTDIRREGAVVTGVIASEPESLPKLRLGQPVSFDMQDIADWGFEKDGLVYGHFTSRVLAAAYPEVAARDPIPFSPNPLPST